MEKSRKRQWLIVGLCWLMYTLAYLARYSFNANITSIIAEYGESRTSVGLISSFFFFSYGIGQVLNGFFCRRYNKKIVLPIAFIVSSLTNLLLFIGIPFEMIKYVWMVNGIAQSFFWTSLILTLSENLDDEILQKASFVISSTAAVGLLVTYGLSALFNYINSFKVIFLVGSIGMAVMAVVWFIAYPKLAQKRKKTHTVVENTDNKKNKLAPAVLIIVIMLALFAIIDNFVKDGISGWMPEVLKSNYGFDDSISILLTLSLPVIGFAFQYLNLYAKKKVKSFVTLAGIWFALALVTLLVCVNLLNTDNWILLVIMLALSVGFMHNVNNVVTSMAPLCMRDSINSGLMAGLMDGFCYVGSTIAMVGLGAISDTSGWDGAFTVLAVLCGVAAAIMLIYLLISSIIKAKKNKESNIKAIVFDLDGTLLNTLDDLHNSVNYMLEKEGYPLRSKEEVRSYLGNGVRALVKRALPQSAQDRLEECLAVFKEYYEIHKNDKTAPYEGIIEMLKEVKAAGYKTAIVSNKYDAAVQQLKNITFEGLIDFALGEGNGIAPKPQPDGVILALEKLGVSKEESIYVGDSEVDLLTAKNSELRCVAVTWGFRDRDMLEREGALNVIDSPDQFIPLISKKIL